MESTIGESTADRAARYRAAGWWPGEGLAARHARIAAERPGALAVVDDRGIRLSHAELATAADALAAMLLARGIGPGDVALILMPNRAEWQVAMLAVLKVGAVPANIPVRTDPDMLAYACNLCGVRILLTSASSGAPGPADGRGPRRPAARAATGGGEVEALARAAASRCEHAPPVLVVDDGGEWSGAGGPARPAACRPDPAPGLDHVMFTSSTTGWPKAVMHTADTLAALHITFTERFGLGPDAPIFMPSPLGHSVGAIHGARLSLFNGAPLVLQDRWDPQAALAHVAEHGCRFTAAATPFLKDLVDAPWTGSAPKLESLAWFLCGGAQVPPALLEAAEAEFPRTRTTVLWGMTEGGLTTCVEASPRDRVLLTAGVALPGLELRVLGPGDEALPPGEQGELAMRGPGVFVGYLGQDDLYASTLTADAFFRTGDLAVLDAQGYLRITGRLKDLIIRGGVNISPVPLEDALAAHPDVQAVAVIGYPDARLGERICAVVVPRPGSPLAAGTAREAEVLKAHAVERGLPKAHWPELVRFASALPRTPAGKIRKNELRERIVDAGCDVATPASEARDGCG